MAVVHITNETFEKEVKEQKKIEEDFLALLLFLLTYNLRIVLSFVFLIFIICLSQDIFF